MPLILPDLNGSKGIWGSILNDALNGLDQRVLSNTTATAANAGAITTLNTTLADHENRIGDVESQLPPTGPPEPPPLSTSDGANQTNFNSAGNFIAGSPECGITFTAPTSGMVLLLFGARAQVNSVNVRVHVSIAVRTGPTIGSGVILYGPSDQCSIETGQPTTSASAGDTSRLQASRHRLITGLTPRDQYNARVEHKTSVSGLGTVFFRDIAVIPLS